MLLNKCYFGKNDAALIEIEVGLMQRSHARYVALVKIMTCKTKVELMKIMLTKVSARSNAGAQTGWRPNDQAPKRPAPSISS